MFMSLQVEQDTLRVDGPVTLYRSSEWAQRAFCSECGSALWYETVHDGHRNLAAGLFDNAGGGVLAMEFNVDCKPQGYAMSGDHERLTEAETLALFVGDAP